MTNPSHPHLDSGKFRHPVLRIARHELKRFWRARSLPPLETVVIQVKNGGRDGFTIKHSRNALTIRAANPRSVLYAVYEILEGLGWRWPRPGVELHRPELAVSSWGKITGEYPSRLAIRGMMTHRPLTKETSAWIEWLSRARYNLFLVPGPHWDSCPPTVAQALADRGLIVDVGHHSFDYFYPHERFSKLAPETFALIDGNRQVRKGRWIADRLADQQVCTTNPKVIRQFAQALDKFSRHHPNVDQISLWPNDGFGWCECETCRRLDVDGQSELHPQYPVYTRRYLEFVKHVDQARKIRTVPLSTLSYVAALEYPTNLKIPKSHVTYLAPYLEDYARPLVDRGARANKVYWKAIRRWIQAGAQVIVYEYWLKNAWLGFPLPIVTQQAKNIARLATAGAAGVATQVELDGWASNELLFWAGGRLLYDRTKTPQELVHQYCHFAYGKTAGSRIAAFWMELEQAMSSAQEVSGFAVNLPKVFSPAIMERWRQLCESLESIGAAEACGWRFRYDRAQAILGMVNLQHEILQHLKSGRLTDARAQYELLRKSHHAFLHGLRQRSLRAALDPWLPLFLRSNVIQPILNELAKLGLDWPSEDTDGSLYQPV